MHKNYKYQEIWCWDNMAGIENILPLGTELLQNLSTWRHAQLLVVFVLLDF